MHFCEFDQGYVSRLMSGDPATERHFAHYFGELIRMTARRRLGRSRAVQPEDVEQETFLRVLRLLRSPGGIRQPESLGGLVTAVCRNVLREMRRAETRGGSCFDETRQAAESEPGMEGQLLRQERRRALYEALGALSPFERRVVEAIFLEEDEREDVARRIGVSRGYLRVLLQRAKARLRRVLAGRAAAA